MLTELLLSGNKIKTRPNNSGVTLNETRMFKTKAIDESSAGPSRGLSQSSPARILDVSWEAAAIGKGAAEGLCLNRSALSIA